jgi:hypothetical protein
MNKQTRDSRHPRKANQRIDRSSFSIASILSDADVTRYWHSQTPQARLRYMEKLRRMNYGNRAAQRMKRVLEIVERGNAAD